MVLMSYIKIKYPKSGLDPKVGFCCMTCLRLSKIIKKIINKKEAFKGLSPIGFSLQITAIIHK